MSHGKQFTLFTYPSGPNGWKVSFILDILGLTYEAHNFTRIEELKGPEHTKYNPNGRIPTLIDHKNNDFAVWESNAIILYLIERYDVDHKISVSAPEEKIALLQWLFFQASGQGPYFGQAIWFSFSHQEKLPSAIERYQNEARRVLGVLESVLSKQEWLVGGKLTVADLSFVPWNNMLTLPVMLGEDFDFGKEFPATYAWHSKMLAIEAVKNGFAVREKLLAAEREKQAAAAAVKA